MREPKIPGPHRSRICRALQARNSRQAWSNHIKIQEKSGAGGGNRTIHAYSFYVTYCKHTNARTAQPAVCPPPMYKIMYKKFEGRVRRGPLNAGMRSSPSRIQDSIRELPDGNVSRQVDAMRMGPAACACTARRG